MTTETLETAPEKRDHGDPLLTSARVIATIIQLFLAIGFVFMIVVLGAVLTVRRPVILAKIAAAGGSPLAYPAVIVGIILILVAIHLGRRFMRELVGIIDSVRAADPFTEANADRLQRMGWLTVGMIAAASTVSILADLFGKYAHALGAHERHGPGFLSSVLMALVLFILARVFRAGHKMRDDLEGTV